MSARACWRPAVPGRWLPCSPSCASSRSSASSSRGCPSRELDRSEEHTSELQSLMRISYAVFCLKKKKQKHALTKNLQSRTLQTTDHNDSKQQTITDRMH